MNDKQQPTCRVCGNDTWDGSGPVDVCNQCGAWPAPDPDTVVIEEEFDHYRLYVGDEELHTHSVPDALAMYEMYNRSSYSTEHYPLESSWNIARKALADLVTEAVRLDQEWSDIAARDLNEIMDYFNDTHTLWVHNAQKDGRTW